MAGGSVSGAFSGYLVSVATVEFDAYLGGALVSDDTE